MNFGESREKEILFKHHFISFRFDFLRLLNAMHRLKYFLPHVEYFNIKPDIFIFPQIKCTMAEGLTEALICT